MFIMQAVDLCEVFKVSIFHILAFFSIFDLEGPRLRLIRILFVKLA